MPYPHIRTEDRGHIRLITIERPEKLNALNRDTIQALSACLSDTEKDQNIRALILTGSGTKAFVAGADIKEFAHFKPAEGKALSADGHRLLFDKIEQMSKPCIAAVNGFALGGGLELAMACHIRLASDNARLGLPEVGLGVIPGYGGTQRLAQLVGKGKALEMITTAGMIKADEALQWGLVNRVCSPESLLDEAWAMAEKISQQSPVAVAAAMRSVLAAYQYDKDGYAEEIEQFGNCFGTEDFVEGTEAFLEKRKPSFTGN